MVKRPSHNSRSRTWPTAAPLMQGFRVLSIFRKFITPLALLAGLASGPYTLSGAKMIHPTIEWNHIPFMFFACAFSMFWVIGLQFFRKDPKPSRVAIIFFCPIAVFLFATGIGALVTSYYYSELIPASLLYLAIGAGMLFGVLLMRLAFHFRYKTAV